MTHNILPKALFLTRGIYQSPNNDFTELHKKTISLVSLDGFTTEFVLSFMKKFVKACKMSLKFNVKTVILN